MGLLPEQVEELTDAVTVMALTLVALLLGATLKLGNLKAHGIEILSISTSVVLATLAVVTGGLLLVGVEFSLALILAAVATSTDPAATQDVLKQSGVKNRFTRILEGIVAVDGI